MTDMEGQRVQYVGEISEWKLQPGMKGTITKTSQRYVMVKWDDLECSPVGMRWEEVALIG